LSDGESEPEIQCYELCNLDQDIEFSSSQSSSEEECCGGPDEKIATQPVIDELNASSKSFSKSESNNKIL